MQYSNKWSQWLWNFIINLGKINHTSVQQHQLILYSPNCNEQVTYSEYVLIYVYKRFWSSKALLVTYLYNLI